MNILHGSVGSGSPEWLIRLEPVRIRNFLGMVQTGPGPRNGSIQSGIILLIVAFGFNIARKY